MMSCFFFFSLKLAEKGDLAHLENLVRKSPEVLNEKDDCGASPLHHAAAGGHVTLIQFIVTVVDPQGKLKTACTVVCHVLNCTYKICMFFFFFSRAELQ